MKIKETQLFVVAVFHFQQFDYDGYGRGFPCAFLIGVCWAAWIFRFISVVRSGNLLANICFCTTFFLFLLWDPNNWVLDLLILSRWSLRFFPFLFQIIFLFVVQIGYYLSVFKFTDSFLWYILLLLSPSTEIFILVIVFFRSKMSFWLFIYPVSLLRLSVFPLVSRVYTPLTSWSVSVIVAFQFLSSNSRICVMSLAIVDFFSLHQLGFSWFFICWVVLSYILL